MQQTISNDTVSTVSGRHFPILEIIISLGSLAHFAVSSGMLCTKWVLETGLCLNTYYKYRVSAEQITNSPHYFQLFLKIYVIICLCKVAFGLF